MTEGMQRDISIIPRTEREVRADGFAVAMQASTDCSRYDAVDTSRGTSTLSRLR